MQKAKGNHHKMSKTHEGLPGVGNNTSEGLPDVENNPKNPSVLGRLGKAAVRAAVRAAESTASYLNRAAETGRDYIGEHTGADAGKSTSEESETLATSASNTSPEKQAPDANESKATKSKADASQGKKTNDGAKSTPEKQASGTNKSDAEKSKANTPDKSVDTSGKQAGEGTKSTPEKQASGTNKSDAEKSKANTPDKSVDTSGKQAGEGAKSTPEKQASSANKSDAEKGETDTSQGKQASGAAADFMRRFLDESKQDKDSNPNTGEAQTKESSPEKREAAVKLDESRKRFAEASVDAESHFFGKKKRQEELKAAAKELKDSGLAYMRLKFADKIEAAKQDPKKQAELAAEMAQAAFASMQETSRVTTDKYDNMLDDRSKFKKAAAKVGKWFNKGGKITQWLKLGGAGFVGGFIVGSVAAWPITAAVGIVTKLGVAGATKQAVLEEHRGEDRIAADDRLEAIDPSFEKAVANMKIGDAMEHAVNVSVDNLKDVSIKRRDALRKKVISSSGKYAVGFVLGGVVGSFINDWWANSAHATGTEGNADTTPQSGSEQTPQSGGASSADNPAAKAIGNSVNPDTPNFSSYDYPWNWAAEKFGDANAMDQLHNLADKAMADGHTVEWYNTGGIEYLEVDGSSVTADVLKVLNKYA